MGATVDRRFYACVVLDRHDTTKPIVWLLGKRPFPVWRQVAALRPCFFSTFRERKHTEKRRYMHRNPVNRGLVKSPELWAWSSFRAYWLDEERPG